MIVLIPGQGLRDDEDVPTLLRIIPDGLRYSIRHVSHAGHKQQLITTETTVTRLPLGNKCYPRVKELACPLDLVQFRQIWRSMPRQHLGRQL
jgi:hypothetical protein